MNRLFIALLILLLLPLVAVAKDDEGETFEVVNPGAHATAVKVIALDAKVGGKFAVAGPDGKDVPAWWDKDAKKLLVLASVPAGGGTFTVVDGAKSKARDPKWGKPKIKKEDKVKLGKTVERVSGEFQNDLLKVTVPVENTVHGRVRIEALKGKYKLELSPLGCSAGCVETEGIGKEVDKSYAAGQQVHDEVFVIYPSIATKIEVLEPNPFQRTMRVQCYAWARKNNEKTLDLFDEASFEITLTWGSPVVKIHSLRKLKTTYWNHNGVDLNEIYIEQQPPSIQADDEEKATERVVTGNVLDIPFKKSIWLKDKTGATVVHQPDFDTLKIYKECMVLAKDRLMTILSQSWHEGWKPIEIKAGDYADTMTLACDVGDDDKTLKDWVTELR
ncbi:MAG: hypothetical protein KDB90_16170 [Planctomycetes bacterium]|nr:hypothetical protein [Planctomycetota bacterium]